MGFKEELAARFGLPAPAETPTPKPEPEPASEMAHSGWAIEYAANLAALGISETSAAEALDEALGERSWHSFERWTRWLAAAIRRATPTRAAEEEAMEGLPSTFGSSKGLPTVSSLGMELIGALRAGAGARRLAERRAGAQQARGLVIPPPESGEDPEDYRYRLDRWARELPRDVERGIAVMVTAAADKYAAAVTRAAAEAEGRARRELAGILADAFEGVVEKLSAWARKEQTRRLEPGGGLRPDRPEYRYEHLLQEAVRASRWPWVIAQAWGGLTYEEKAGIYLSLPHGGPCPTEDDHVPVAALVKAAAAGGRSEAYAPALRRIVPLAEGACQVVGDLAVLATGKVVRPRGERPGDGVHPTEPAPSGWMDLGGRSPRWASSDSFRALQRAQEWAGGCCGIRAAFTGDSEQGYGRHPERGFPRLHVCAWKTWGTVPLPDGQLGAHLDALQTLVKAELTHQVPEAAWWVDLVPGLTQAGRPRLGPGHGPRARLVFLREQESSRGRHGVEGDCRRAQPSEKGTATVLASVSGSSGGGGQRVQTTVAYIREGEVLALASGAGIDWTGARIPGAGAEE